MKLEARLAFDSLTSSSVVWGLIRLIHRSAWKVNSPKFRHGVLKFALDRPSVPWASPSGIDAGVRQIQWCRGLPDF